MSNLYADRASDLDAKTESDRETFEELFRESKSYDAQLIATAVVYAGDVIAAALYRAMEKP